MPTPTNQTLQNYSWTDAQGTATATVDVTNPDAPVLVSYQVLGTSTQLLSYPNLTQDQIRFVNVVYTDLLTALTLIEE